MSGHKFKSEEPYERRTNLNSLAAALPDAPSDPKDGNELCAVCSKVDLDSININYSQKHGDVYNLGSLEDILQKKTCPLCRLVSSIFRSARFYHTKTVPVNDLYCTLGSKWVGTPRINPSVQDISTEYTISEHVFTHRLESYAIQVKFKSKPDSPPERQHCTSCAEIHIIQTCSDTVTSRKSTIKTRPRGQNRVEVLPYKWQRSRGCIINAEQIDFQRVEQWLHLCQTSHGKLCEQRTPEQRNSITRRIRLLDVHDYRIVDGSASDRYLALSYVWGGAPQMTLNKENYDDLTAFYGLKDKNLPRAIADAIKVTKRIHERYLCVDRLCILSDDERDKVEQLSIMDEIYGCATLTIIGADLCCAGGPLPGVEPGTRPKLQHSEVVNGIQYTTGQPRPT